MEMKSIVILNKVGSGEDLVRCDDKARLSSKVCMINVCGWF